MKRLGWTIACILILISQTGCWDIKTIQDTNYFTAIGFDYQNGRYVVYAQMLDFSSVAKQEAGKAGQPPQIWVGREEEPRLMKHSIGFTKRRNSAFLGTCQCLFVLQRGAEARDW